MSRKPFYLFIGFLLTLLILVQACTAGPSSIPREPDTGDFVADDFKTTTNTWAQFETAESAAYVEQGELYLEDRGRGIGVYTQIVGQEFADVAMRFTVRHVEGTQDNWMGAICRHQDDENYYLLAISADAYYLILKVENGSPTALSGPTPADVIRTGREQNQVEVSCNGDVLTLRINDSLEVSEIDSSFQLGKVALFTDAVRGGTTTTAFDDFRLFQP